MPQLEIGNTAHVGDEVIALGFPWGGDELSLTKGIVSRVEMFSDFFLIVNSN